MALFTHEQLHSSQGHKLTRALFWETRIGDDTPIMSLNRKEGYVCIRPIFIELTKNDPTELVFAEHVFGDYAFWKNVTKAKWMDSYLEEWRMVADVQRKSDAFRAVISEVRTQGRSAFSAAKFLIDEPWKDKRNPKNKAAVKKSTETAHRGLEADVKRMQDYI